MKGITIALGCLAVAGLTVTAAAGGGTRRIAPGTQLYVPQAQQQAKQQIAKLTAQGDRAGAAGLAAMQATAQAVWIDGGSADDARVLAQKTVLRAAGKDQLPALVLYNLPFRDCGQYSAGGARSTAEYEAWIDGVAAGIGDRPAMVILEPDGLGIIPYNDGEWCRPDLTGSGLTPQQAHDQRFVQLNYAVDALAALPGTLVYLDGTHPAWLGVGDVAKRLVDAGVLRAQGFFLNVSNYQATPQNEKYGTWISKCIAFANDPEEGGWRLGHYDWCASQYYPADPHDFGTWGRTDAWYDANLGHAVPTARFVIDTSRNGQGPWTPPAGVYSDPQDWCNPPGRGLGLRPTVDTAVPLLDAYLWVKTPGQSDGSCTRGTAGPTDPEWNLVDPPAGAWFPEQALQLVQLANPPLAP